MNDSKLITVEQLAPALKKAAEGIKKKPGLMKSSGGFMDLVSTYVERIVTAKEKGKWVVAHSTQVPVEIFEAMDCVGVFNEFWGVITDVVNLESVLRPWPSRPPPARQGRSAPSTGTWTA